MKNTTYTRGGWKHEAKADRAPNASRNLNHGNNTLIGQVPATLSLNTGRGIYNAAGCGACKHFPTCPKGVKADTMYCQWRPNRFQHARAR